MRHNPAERPPTADEANHAPMRRAFTDRNVHLGDPAFVRNPVGRLLSKDYAATLRAGIRRALE